ncbi:hypothetical protein QQP08_003702 [Theobroma cacao]|nr:hypothetical protein QQP08_003702 [Theobroma cacao]
MLTSMKMETQQQGETAGGIKRKGELRFEGLKPYAICIFCNICFAGYNIISKVSLDNGMSSYVLVVYGPVFGTPPQLFLHCYLKGLKDTSPAVASALANLIPSMTFVLAVLCRMEALDMSKHSARAKVGGSVVALAGATLMTLYKGCALISPHSHHTQASSKLQFNKDWIKGSLMLLLCYLSLSAFLVLQTVTVKKYPAPITLTSLTCLSGTLVSAIMTAAVDHKASSWRLSWDMSLVAILYSRSRSSTHSCRFVFNFVGKGKGEGKETAGGVQHLLNALKSDQKSDNTWIL